MSGGPFSLGAVAKRHKWLSSATKGAVEAALRAGAEHAVQRVRRFPGFTHRTGRTARATTWAIKLATNRSVATVRNGRDVATYLEYGTRPHIIRARHGYLRFYWPKVGQWMTLRQVSHPGTRPYHTWSIATRSGAYVTKRLLAASMRAHAKAF